MAYMRLGDLLIAAGAITQEQLEEALTIQKQKKERLGDVLKVISSRSVSSLKHCKCSSASISSI